MAGSIVSDLIGRLLEFLGQSAAEKIAPYFGGRGKLDDLKLTMKMMQARLYDAERRQEAEDRALTKEWLRQLKRVMCRLEDLLEELAIADEQDDPGASGRLTKVVCYLPSKFSSLKMNRTLLLEAEDIMRELERITSNMARFHFTELVVDQQRMNMINRREDTISFIQRKRL
uniref:Disease resistance N-terminal domain-containing protein n=1 Tax=Opuntia streptacantha TaxID=393608 RepID=A0A7C9DQ99_OPUST